MMNHRKRRRGYVMVLFAMLLFGIMAMAALVIDIGFARLAQRQMQTAVDSAALEGLRGLGIIAYDDRQANAENFIAWQFDDDLDAANRDDGIAGDGGAFNAGPIISFSGGAGDPSIYASQLMTVDPDNAVYKPRRMQRRDEPDDEERKNTFQVIMQRGGAIEGDPDLFDLGPSVPYLFARGSLINRETVRGGMSVRALSTAESVPALKIGDPVFDSANVEIYPGPSPIGYELNDWNGTKIDPNTQEPLLPRLEPRSTNQVKVVGLAITAVGSAQSPLPDGICAIYTKIDGVDRVVGFGRISVGAALPSYVALANASGRLSSVWSELDSEHVEELLSANRSIIGGLRVPVLQALGGN